MQPLSLFITGTDTGVGKSLVTALLALRLQSQGVDVGVMKPFATGCEWLAGRSVNEDAWFLKEVTGVADDLDLINPVRFEEPLAPLVAARRLPTYDPASPPDFMPAVWEAYQELQRRHECVLVEGVGGLLVPLQEKVAVHGEASAASLFYTCADFANDLGLPVVVVARRKLGTINHTALTCRVPLQAPAHFAGLVFCDGAQGVPRNDVAAETSAALIAELTGLDIWGNVPTLVGLDITRFWLHGAVKTVLPSLSRMALQDLKRAAQEHLTRP